MKNKRIFVLGYFGYETNQLDGQTVKTRNIYKLLSKNAHDSLIYFDSQKLKKSRLCIVELLYKLISADKIIMIPAGNMMRKTFPIADKISRLFKSDIIYIPVGGWLSSIIRVETKFIPLFKSVKALMPQTQRQVDELKEEFNFDNVVYFPNFRINNFIPETKSSSSVFRLVFCARIHKLKGLDVCFSIAQYYNDNDISDKILIDFYGQINSDDKEYFYEEVAKYSFVNYKGVLQPNEIYNTLSNYDVMLFPTRYLNDEGFPGSILDAYISGIPVIASEWIHSHEFINENVSGFICDVNKPYTFIDKIESLRNSPSNLNKMKKGAFLESKKYNEESAWNIIKKYLE